MQGMDDIQKELQLLAELKEFARGGIADGIKKDNGMGDEPSVEMMGDQKPEDPEIPGVEAEPGEGTPDEEAQDALEDGGTKLDPMKLKALLAQLQAKG